MVFNKRVINHVRYIPMGLFTRVILGIAYRGKAVTVSATLPIEWHKIPSTHTAALLVLASHETNHPYEFNL
jgi:hypothetical protein